MIFRALDQNGDWQFGNGQQDYLTKEAAIELNLKTALMFFLNDCFWAMTFGIDWWNLLGGKNPQAELQILVQTRAMILSQYGVVRINSVNASLDAKTRLLRVAYNINTLFTRNLAGVISPG